VWTIDLADDAFGVLGITMVLTGALVVGRSVLLLVVAVRHARRRRRAGFRWDDEVTAPVSIVVPAHNERENVAAAVRSLAAGDHPGIEVLVVDDGSNDGTVYGFLFHDRSEAVLAWLAMLGVQVLLAVVAFRLDGECLRAIWLLPLQQVIYRQLIYLVLIKSLTTAVTGARLRWHKLDRTGAVAALACDLVARDRG
jgi:hypothetical protein